MALDLRIYKAATMNDLAGNGGLMSANRSISGASTNLFPRTTLDERTAGVAYRLRKAFYKMCDAADTPFYNAHIIPFLGTPALDYVTYFAGTQTDIQSDVLAAGISSYDHYGAGLLNQSVSAGGQTLIVDCAAATPVIFRVGDMIHVSNKTDYTGTGDSEYLTVDTVSYVGPQATITVLENLSNSYTHTVTTVSSVYEHGTLQYTAVEDSSSIAGDGAINYADTDFVVTHLSGVYEQWTLDFTSSTAFTCTGNTLGVVGSGTTGAGIAPTNPDFSDSYFVLPASAFSGTFANGDQIVWTSTPAAVPMWHNLVVPAGIGAVAGNSFTGVFAGEYESP